MKASKFSDAQKAFILKQGDEGVPVAEICRKAGISQATYFNWRKKYAGLLPDEMRRLKALEDENSRLKKIVADLTLDGEMLQDVSAMQSTSRAFTNSCDEPQGAISSIRDCGILCADRKIWQCRFVLTGKTSALVCFAV